MNKSKLIFLLFALLSTAIGLKAQVYAGGTLAILDYNGETLIQVAPEVGYNINSKWAVAGKFAYTHYDGGNELLVNPYVRFTFLQKNILSLFVDGGAELYRNESWYYGGGLTPGLAIKATDRISFVAKYGFLGYRESEYSETSGFSLGSNDLNFGFYYTF